MLNQPMGNLQINEPKSSHIPQSMPPGIRPGQPLMSSHQAPIPNVQSPGRTGNFGQPPKAGQFRPMGMSPAGAQPGHQYPSPGMRPPHGAINGTACLCFIFAVYWFTSDGAFVMFLPC